VTVSPDLRQAKALVGARAYRQAKPILAGLLAENPDDEWLMGAMVQTLIGLNDISNAVPMSERLVAAHPNSAQAQRFRAAAANRAKLHQQAYVAAMEAVRLEPDSWRGHHLVAVASMNMKELDQAERAADESLRLAPDEPDAHYGVGLVAQRRGQRKKAHESYRNALAIDPEHAFSLGQLTKMDLSGSLADRVHRVRHVLRLDPTVRSAESALDASMAGIFLPSLLAAVVGEAIVLIGALSGVELWIRLFGWLCGALLTVSVVTPILRIRGLDRNLRRLLAARLRTSRFVRRSALVAVSGNALVMISLVVWVVVLLQHS
jgi:tetratricopeptide (TPR) repeat protein